MRRSGESTPCARHRAGILARVALCATLVFALAPAAVSQGAKPHTLPVTVSADETHPGTPVPPEFLGLSFEASSLGQIATYGERGDLVALMRSLGSGVIRFGGVSADTRVAWADAATPRPAWASSVLEVAQLRELATLAARSGWRVLLTIGLAHYEPEAAAREAAAAKATLGSSLEGIELGNEPNAYALHGLRSEPWTFVQYDAQVAAYRSAIEAAAPGIAVAGPDVSGSSAFESWGPGEAVDQTPVLLTGHHYPLGCEQVPAPTITRLLSPQIRRLENASLLRYMSIAQASETPFRLDETNTVSCGGVAGISNTFASALWATAYLTEGMQVGVAGMNLEGNPANCSGYTPLCAPTAEDLAAGTLTAQPEWYALLLAKALIGDRPLPVRISSPSHLNVIVSALRTPDGGLHFVLVDDDLPGAHSVAVRLKVGRGFRGANILSLTAASPAALSGVRLGGRAVAPDGSWSEPARLPHAPNKDGVITVQIKPASAALLSVSEG